MEECSKCQYCVEQRTQRRKNYISYKCLCKYSSHYEIGFTFLDDTCGHFKEIKRRL
jgi:hypothetical protein